VEGLSNEIVLNEGDVVVIEENFRFLQGWDKNGV
jgi:hypothetical protein